MPVHLKACDGDHRTGFTDEMRIDNHMLFSILVLYTWDGKTEFSAAITPVFSVTKSRNILIIKNTSYWCLFNINN